MKPLERPNWRQGVEIFASRPLSLIAALVLAVVVCVASFMLLAFPMIAGYYYAIRQSKREEYFIDLPNISRTSFLVLEGAGKHFVQGYVLGLIGLLPAAILYLAPVLPWAIGGEGWAYASVGLMILWLPSFFLTGVMVFNGYPYLIATNDGMGSIRHALSAGGANPLLAVARGFMLLYPVPGWIIHFLMVFSYPIIAAWAVSASGDTVEIRAEIQQMTRNLWVGVATGLLLSGILVGFCFLFVSLWEIAGFVGWLILAFVSVFIWARGFNVKNN